MMTQAPATRKTRRSAQFPGLTYELNVTERGTFIEFRFGAAFSVYAIQNGCAFFADCSDRAELPRAMDRYCRAFAQQLAGKMAGKVAA